MSPPPKWPRWRAATAVLLFVACALGANLLTSRYGPIPVGFGLTATAGTWLAGLVLLARDWVHDTAGRTTVLACIVAGAALSAATVSPRLALASGVAFLISELADLAVYTPLRQRSWAGAVAASNTVGAAADTIVFLLLAGLPLATALPGQLALKTVVTVAAIAAVTTVRAFLRHRVRAARP